MLFSLISDFPEGRIGSFAPAWRAFEGHPVNKIPGIEATTKPLGQGISFGNGIAIALKMDKSKSRLCVVRRWRASRRSNLGSPR